MKELFQEVEIEVICFEADVDVITSSGGFDTPIIGF